MKISRQIQPIPEHAICIQCGYALRGLSSDAHCPECGTKVSASLQRFALATSSVTYLKRIRFAVLMMGIGAMTFPFTMHGAVLSLLILPSGSSPHQISILVSKVGVPLSVLVFVVGTLMLSSRTRQEGYEGHGDARIGIQFGVALLAPAVVLSVCGSMFMWPYTIMMFFGLAAMVAPIGILVLFLSAQTYIIWLAERIPDNKIQKNARLHRRIGTWTFLCIVSPGVSMFFDSEAFQRLGEGIALMGLAIAVAVGVFWLINLNRLRIHLSRMINTKHN